MPDEPTLPFSPPFQPIQVPLVYANGFQIGISNGDSSLFFNVDNIPQVRCSLSYNVLKSLSVKLAQVVEQLEKDLGQTILTTDDLGPLLNKS